MPRKKSPTLTDAELKIMEILWDHGRATVKDVADALSKTQPVAYNTALTMLKILAEKGHAKYEKQGRAFIYQPVLDRGQARRSALRYTLSRFFNNSPTLLVQNLLEDERFASEELANLKEKILAAREED